VQERVQEIEQYLLAWGFTARMSIVESRPLKSIDPVFLERGARTDYASLEVFVHGFKPF